MAKDFVRLSEVTMLEEVADNASVLVEQNGEVYRAPKSQVGGAGKNTLIATVIEDVCTVNMTFEEFAELYDSHEFAGGRLIKYHGGMYVDFAHLYSITNYGDEVWFQFRRLNGDEYYIGMYPDGHIEYEAPSGPV